MLAASEIQRFDGIVWGQLSQIGIQDRAPWHAGSMTTPKYVAELVLMRRSHYTSRITQFSLTWIRQKSAAWNYARILVDKRNVLDHEGCHAFRFTVHILCRGDETEVKLIETRRAQHGVDVGLVDCRNDTS